MNGAAALLRTALSRCAVRLSGDGCRGGSGFFVAPGYVVTCAHVVADEGSSVIVTWEGMDYEGIVRFREPAGAAATRLVLGYPDLAVVQLAAPPDQPCVWLWLGDTIPDEDVPLYAVGYNTVYSGGDPELAGLPLTAGGPQKLEGATLIRVKGDELPRGTSGGPIIDLTTGRVMAIVKTTRQANTPYGGVAIPLGVLRRVPRELQAAIRDGHDSYHASESWPAMVDRLRLERRESPTMTAWTDPGYALPMLSALEEAELMGLLANLPPTGSLSALFRGACGPDFPDPGQDLLDRRDVVRVLDDLMAAPRWALPPLLAFVELVADELAGEQAAALRVWSDRCARKWGRHRLLRGRRSTPSRRAPDEPTSVIARVSPSGNDRNHYLLTVWLYLGLGNFQTIVCDEGPFALADLWQHLRDMLPGTLRRLDSKQSTLVELVVPSQLLDTAVDEWPLWSRHRARLGRLHPVVVRVIDDEDDPERVRRSIEERWEALRGRPIGAHLRWLHCDEELDDDHLDRWFRRSCEHAALGLPGPAGDQKHYAALDVALFAGTPVAFWRRIPCDRHGEAVGADSDNGDEGHEVCSGYRFSQTLTERLDGVTVDQLPHTIRKLRSDDDHYLNGVVLLWQNPARQVPIGDPLMFPQ